MNTKNIIIREITTGDISGIRNIHRSCEDPWNDIEECASWVTKRIERGFYMQAAELDGKVVGHGEWIISDEPDRKYLYLGLLQIDADYQRMGIGRKMIADGIEYAKSNGCDTLVTIPDTEDNSIEFYRKCGFKEEREIYKLEIPSEICKDYICSGKGTEKVPFEVIKHNRFLLGKCQISSRHMWEVCNEKPCSDTGRRTPAVLLEDGTYIQLSYFPEWEGGGTFAQCWAAGEDYGHILKSTLSLAYSNGRKAVELYYLEDEEAIFNGFDTCKKKKDNVELVYYIRQL